MTGNEQELGVTSLLLLYSFLAVFLNMELIEPRCVLFGLR
jgi:hypothetical protein